MIFKSAILCRASGREISLPRALIPPSAGKPVALRIKSI